MAKKDKFDAVVERRAYSRDELFRKERMKEPMTYGEVEALKREKQKDLTNQILRVAGLFAILFAVSLAVFCFLYPFSLFNLFTTSKGGGDQFWDLWNNWSVNVGKDYTWQDLFTKSVSVNEEGIEIVSYDTFGYATMKTILSHGFQGGSTWKANFYALGGWSIILIATIGLVAIVVYAVYIVAYNIRDLINVIKHFIHRTAYIATDVASVAAESVDSTKDKKKKTTTTKRRKEEKPVSEAPSATEEPLPDINVEELIAEKEKKETKTDEVTGLSNEQLDALLGGASMDEVENLK